MCNDPVRSPSRALGAGALLALLAACSSSGPAPAESPRVEVATWGTMREVLRLGRSEARVTPVEVATPRSVGVGALAGLAGEVTIVDGSVLVATASPDVPGGCEVRGASGDDRAALLVLADVPEWEEYELAACADYAALDGAIAQRLSDLGFASGEAVPVRVRGRASHLELHVVAGACPVADPTGPPPWRHAGGPAEVELVGVFAEGAAGRLTHHTHRSHLHAITAEAMGHLDEVALDAGAVLSLPRR